MTKFQLKLSKNCKFFIVFRILLKPSTVSLEFPPSRTPHAATPVISLLDLVPPKKLLRALVIYICISRTLAGITVLNRCLSDYLFVPKITWPSWFVQIRGLEEIDLNGLNFGISQVSYGNGIAEGPPWSFSGRWTLRPQKATTRSSQTVRGTSAPRMGKTTIGLSFEMKQHL